MNKSSETNVSSNKALSNTVQEQNNVADLTLAPKIHERLKSLPNTFQDFRIDPRTLFEHSKDKATSRNGPKDLSRKTDSKTEPPGHPDKQQTLVHPMSTDESQPGHEKTGTQSLYAGQAIKGLGSC